MISEQQRKKSSTENDTFPFQLVVTSQQITNQIDELYTNDALKFPDELHADEHDRDSLISRERRYQQERRRRRLAENAMPDTHEDPNPPIDDGPPEYVIRSPRPLRGSEMSTWTTPRATAITTATSTATSRATPTATPRTLTPRVTPRTRAAYNVLPRASSSTPSPRRVSIAASSTADQGAYSMPMTPRNTMEQRGQPSAAVSPPRSSPPALRGGDNGRTPKARTTTSQQVSFQEVRAEENG